MIKSNIILNKFIKNINNANNTEDLFNIIINYELKFGLNFPLKFSIQSDFNDSSYNILHIST